VVIAVVSAPVLIGVTVATVEIVQALLADLALMGGIIVFSEWPIFGPSCHSMRGGGGPPGGGGSGHCPGPWHR
jgi:hypothetical protein